MKKIIAVLLVLCCCGCLWAVEIEFGWTVEVIKALETYWTPEEIASFDMEKVDEKTLKVKMIFKEEGWDYFYDYYFRFNLSNEDVYNDRSIFIDKAGEKYKLGWEFLSEDHKLTIFENKPPQLNLLVFYHSLEGDYQQLTHYFCYGECTAL